MYLQYVIRNCKEIANVLGTGLCIRPFFFVTGDKLAFSTTHCVGFHFLISVKAWNAWKKSNAF